MSTADPSPIEDDGIERTSASRPAPADDGIERAPDQKPAQGIDRPDWLVGADESPLQRKLGVFEAGERSALAVDQPPVAGGAAAK